jgi:hypothetical protein
VEGSCEHGIEPAGSIKCREVLELLHNWRILKKISAVEVSIDKRCLASCPVTRLFLTVLRAATSVPNSYLDVRINHICTCSRREKVQLT